MTAAVALPQKVIPPAGGSAAVDASQQAAFGGDVSTSLTSTMADPAGAQAVRLAVTLNLARALIRSGTKEGAGEAVQIYASLEAGGSTTLDADPPSLVAYAAALEATGKPDQALSTLERAVERVSTDGQKSDRARLTFVLALARAYISKGRVGDAYALVLAHTCDLVSPGNQPPGSGTTPEADLAVQLWAAVLVGAASDVLPGVGAVPAVHAGQKVELEEVAAALLSWAGARSDVGQAEVGREEGWV
jgi:HrpA-like RNA helicase